jgi:2-hydroxychromene-2-carboxylate isomerase
MPGSPVFHLDVGSPYAYLAAERIARGALGVEPAWRPVLLGAIFKATGRGSWARTDARAAGMREVERRAAAYGLPPIAWPDPWPGDMLRAMRAATAADMLDDGGGAGRAFLLAAMRLAFRDGRDLGEHDAIRDAARDAGLDPEALAAALDDPAVKARLRESTEEALARGVRGVPTVLVGDELFWGDDRLDQAAAAIR